MRDSKLQPDDRPLRGRSNSTGLNLALVLVAGVFMLSCTGERPEFGSNADWTENNAAGTAATSAASGETNLPAPQPGGGDNPPSNLGVTLVQPSPALMGSETTPVDPSQAGTSPSAPSSEQSSTKPITAATPSSTIDSDPSTTNRDSNTATEAPTETTQSNGAAPDCRGVAGGVATVDECGVCDDQPNNDCKQDCNGAWGGAATADACGACDDDPSNDCVDCEGIPGGDAKEDECGTCDADPGNDCAQDCAGAWGGAAVADNCHICDDNPDNDCAQDCAGTWGGSSVPDNCQVCDANPNNDCTQDCNGVWGGDASEDMCGVCDANAANDCAKDCAGDWGGEAVMDACETCDTDPENDCFDGESGTLETVEDSTFDLGSGAIYWGISGAQNGWIYSNTFPDVTYARMIAISDCGQVGGNGSGYQGFDSLGELTDASSLTFALATDPILFGTMMSDCYMGLLVFHQGEQYGVLEFEKLEEAGAVGARGDVLTLNWWLGNPGVTNFSNAQ